MVQFICPECEQPLEPANDTTLPTMCPNCGIHLSFDMADQAPSPPVDQGGLQASDSAARQPWFVPDGSYLRIHRSVAYSQAILLAVVSIISFVLGAGFGGLYSPNSSQSLAAKGPCDVDGTVTQVRQAGQAMGQNGAVVVFLPVDRRPDERWPIQGLRPDEDLPPLDDPSLVGIRLLGGAYARTDPRGRYAVRVAAPGDYYALVIGGRLRHDTGWNKRDLAQIGRYFEDVMGLLNGRDYRWQKLTVTPGEQWDVSFGPEIR